MGLVAAVPRVEPIPPECEEAFEEFARVTNAASYLVEDLSQFEELLLHSDHRCLDLIRRDTRRDVFPELKNRIDEFLELLNSLTGR